MPAAGEQVPPVETARIAPPVPALKEDQPLDKRKDERPRETPMATATDKPTGSNQIQEAEPAAADRRILKPAESPAAEKDEPRPSGELADPPPMTLEQQASAHALAAQRDHAGQYAVQLMVACQRGTLEKLIATSHAPGVFWFIPFNMRGKTCYKIF